VSGGVLGPRIRGDADPVQHHSGQPAFKMTHVFEPAAEIGRRKFQCLPENVSYGPGRGSFRDATCDDRASGNGSPRTIRESIGLGVSLSTMLPAGTERAAGSMLSKARPRHSVSEGISNVTSSERNPRVRTAP